MKVLVTGGTGTISSAIVRECVKRNYNTYSLTRGRQKYRNVENAIYLYTDVRNSELVAKMLKTSYFDCVVECLVYTVKQLKISLENFANRCDVYVFISTSGIFERSIIPVTENSPLWNTEWDYTENKIKCEEYLKQYCAEHKLRYIIVRPSITYGRYRIPFPIATRKPGWTFFKRLLEHKPMLACNNSLAPMVYEEDFSRAVVNLFKNEKAFNEDYNVAFNDSDRWDDVIRCAGEILGVEPVIVHSPLEVFKEKWPEIYDELRWNKVSDLVMDGRKLQDISGVNSGFTSLKEGMTKIIHDMKAEFYDNGLQIDKIWDEKCDDIIKYLYG